MDPIFVQLTFHSSYFVGFKLREPSSTGKADYHMHKRGIKKSPSAIKTKKKLSVSYKLFLPRIPTVAFS
jgi:hypothetical protein